MSDLPTATKFGLLGQTIVSFIVVNTRYAEWQCASFVCQIKVFVCGRDLVNLSFTVEPFGAKGVALPNIENEKLVIV